MLLEILRGSNCRTCDALRDEVKNLREQRDKLYEDLKAAMQQTKQQQQPERSHHERSLPVPLPSSGWGSVRSKLEAKYKKPENPQADKVEQYWKEKNVTLEEEAGIAAELAKDENGRAQGDQ